jgi:hypothetical protein
MRARTLAAGVVAAALLAYCAGGKTQAGEVITSFDQPSLGVGMICNTADQAQQYLQLRAEGAAAADALQKVNDGAHDVHACGIAAIAYVRDKMLQCHAVENKMLEVVRIAVLAGYDGTSWKSLPAMTQYAVMEGQGDAI